MPSCLPVGISLIAAAKVEEMVQWASASIHQSFPPPERGVGAVTFLTDGYVDIWKAFVAYPGSYDIAGHSAPPMLLMAR